MKKLDISIKDMRYHKGDSAFLVDDGDTAILYDTGFGFTGEGVADNVERELGKRSLDYIFLTHSHYDHALGSPNVKRRYPDAKVVAGEYAARIFEKSSAKAVMRDLDRKFARSCGVEEYEDLADFLAVDIAVADGDVINAGNMSFEVLNIPGHTRCSVGYYCRERKLLLGCETLGVYDGEGSVVPSYLVGYDMTVKSIERAMALEAEHILVPHFGLLSGEAAKLYLEAGMKSAVETASEICGMLRQSKSKDEAVEYFKDKYYKGYITEIYPVDAMKLNTGITVELLCHEFGINA